MEPMPCEEAHELVHATRDLMHQGALFTLDVAAGRSRDDLENRAAMMVGLLTYIRKEIDRLPPGPCERRKAYWDTFYETRQNVCFKCAFRRDPDPQAELAAEQGRLDGSLG